MKKNQKSGSTAPSFCVGVNGTPGALGDETLRYWFNVTFTILVSVQGPEVLLQHASERDLISSGQAGPGNRLFLSGFLCSSVLLDICLSFFSVSLFLSASLLFHCKTSLIVSNICPKIGSN